MENDTICAIATAPGGAIGIVRLSGSQSFPIIRRICPRITSSTPPRTATFTVILAPSSPSTSPSSPSLSSSSFSFPSSPVPSSSPSPVSSSPLSPSFPSSSSSPVPSSSPSPVSSSPLPPSSLSSPLPSSPSLSAYDAAPPHPSLPHPPLLDEALVTLFPAPASYTGEDCAEISCHGSRYILNKLLELLIQNGARLANPGEFTQRAYLNGKLDLSQAEAVADLIASTNHATHQMAMSQLRGGISTELSRLRDQLLKLTSLLELELDFSDHEDLEFADRTELLELAQKIDTHITHLARTFETGQALKQGIPVAIVGKTNVGKSTLLNRLLHEDRAIVSDIHGTTRDTIEDVMTMNGVNFRFIDTAGIRQTTDTVEQIGIERTYAAIDKARIVLWLIDEAPTPTELADMQQRCIGKNLIPVWNKVDITPPWSKDLPPVCNRPDLATVCDKLVLATVSDKPAPTPVRNNSYLSPVSCDHAAVPPPLPISAKTGQGIDILEQAIFDAANLQSLSENDIIVTSARQYQSLIKAHENLLSVIASLQMNLSGDLISIDLNLVLDDLAEITGQGRIIPSEVLENIFKTFCVGK